MQRRRGSRVSRRIPDVSQKKRITRSRVLGSAGAGVVQFMNVIRARVGLYI